MSGESLVIPGLVNKMTAQMHRWLPRRLVTQLVRGAQERRH
jgi:short-subunit dehydrogenase